MYKNNNEQHELANGARELWFVEYIYRISVKTINYYCLDKNYGPLIKPIQITIPRVLINHIIVYLMFRKL